MKYRNNKVEISFYLIISIFHPPSVSVIGAKKERKKERKKESE